LRVILPPVLIVLTSPANVRGVAAWADCATVRKIRQARADAKLRNRKPKNNMELAFAVSGPQEIVLMIRLYGRPNALNITHQCYMAVPPPFLAHLGDAGQVAIRLVPEIRLSRARFAAPSKTCRELAPIGVLMNVFCTQLLINRLCARRSHFVLVRDSTRIECWAYLRQWRPPLCPRE